MKLERIKSLKKAGESNIDTDTVLAGDTDSTGEALNWGELRFLLDTAAQAARTCEWRQNTICKGTIDVDGFRTSCGVSNSETHPSKFCEDCGGRVVIRDGRT